MDKGKLSRLKLMSLVVLTAALGSFVLALVDATQRTAYMQIANGSLGAWWALQRPIKDSES